jgi:hypothetical protein
MSSEMMESIPYELPHDIARKGWGCEMAAPKFYGLAAAVRTPSAGHKVKSMIRETMFKISITD